MVIALSSHFPAATPVCEGWAGISRFGFKCSWDGRSAAARSADSPSGCHMGAGSTNYPNNLSVAGSSLEMGRNLMESGLRGPRDLHGLHGGRGRDTEHGLNLWTTLVGIAKYEAPRGANICRVASLQEVILGVARRHPCHGGPGRLLFGTVPVPFRGGNLVLLIMPRTLPKQAGEMRSEHCRVAMKPQAQ